MVVGVGAVRCGLYLAAKPSHAGDDIDRLSYPLHHPTAFGCWPGVQSSWFETILPYLVAKHLLGEPLPLQAHMV
jgi:hypothetical protein